MPQLESDDPRVVGNYEIIAKLGEGGMGTVYKGRSRGGRSVAVKLAKPELAQNAEFRLRFETEIEAAKRVGGFHTAQVIDADPSGRPPWMVTAYIPGPTLGTAVREQGAMSEPRLRALAAALAEALHAIHANDLVHRDLKPANIILADDGPRVLDFGIARALQSSRLTSTHVSVGTPGFWAPEQVRNQEVGPAADVFALGSVLVFAAGGSAFGEGDSLAMMYRALHEEPDLSAVPAGLTPLVTACLSKDAALRPTPDEVLDRLSGEGWTSAGQQRLADAVDAPRGFGPPPEGVPDPRVAPPAAPAQAPSPPPLSPPAAVSAPPVASPTSKPEAGLGSTPVPAAASASGPAPAAPADADPVPAEQPGTPPPAPSDAPGTPPPGTADVPGRPTPGTPEAPGTPTPAAPDAAPQDAGPGTGPGTGPHTGARTDSGAATGDSVVFSGTWKGRGRVALPWLVLFLLFSVSWPDNVEITLIFRVLSLVWLVPAVFALRHFLVTIDGWGVRAGCGWRRVTYAWADIERVEFLPQRSDGSARLRLRLRPEAALPAKRHWMTVDPRARQITVKLRGRDFPRAGMREAVLASAPEGTVVPA